MGMGSSKVDNYVLKVNDGRPSKGLKNKGETGASPLLKEGSKVGRKKPHARIDTSDTETRSPPSRGGVRRGSTGKVADDCQPLPRLGHAASASKLQTQASNKALIRSSSSVSGKGTMQCSHKFHWLIKKANLSGTQLGDYEFGKIIGKGLMGTVYITKSKTGKYLVFKSVRKDFIVKHHDQRHIQNEKLILTTLDNPFCVKLFGTFQDKSNLYFALEFCPGGELFHRLGRKRQFTPPVTKFYISEVFVALEYVQSRGFVYRDLKPENIILDEEGHCKLVDFGFATACADGQKLKTLCGTPAYLSPEQLDGKFTNGYTRVVDWWSFGVLVFELLTGKTPFCKSNKESHYEIFLRILNKKINFPWGFDAISKDLVSKLCHAQLDKRLCAPQDIKRHEYFEIPWDQVMSKRLVPPFVPKLKDEGDVAKYFDCYPSNGVNRGSGGSDGDGGYGFFDF